MTEFVEFFEDNEHEGETWRFWLQLDGNLAELRRLERAIIEVSSAHSYGCDYELDLDTPVSEHDVDVLVSRSRRGYMKYETKVVGRLKLPDDLVQQSDYGPTLDSLYKGEIVKYFTKNDVEPSTESG